MNEIIYMKAGYEPWWMFSGWEEYIVDKQVFTCDKEASAYLESLLSKFRSMYPHEANQKGACWAFWTEDEQEFCEACDDDLQTYHGVMWLNDGKPNQL
jgi:hypothetical protein